MSRPREWIYYGHSRGLDEWDWIFPFCDFISKFSFPTWECSNTDVMKNIFITQYTHLQRPNKPNLILSKFKLDVFSYLTNVPGRTTLTIE